MVCADLRETENVTFLRLVSGDISDFQQQNSKISFPVPDGLNFHVVQASARFHVLFAYMRHELEHEHEREHEYAHEHRKEHEHGHEHEQVHEYNNKHEQKICLYRVSDCSDMDSLISQ